MESSSVTLECDCLAHRFGNAADSGFRRPRYPTDMTDAEWAAIRPLLPVPGWMRGRGGQPEAYCHRAILDAIRYLVDNGVKWRSMPADFPPWDRVYAFLRRWRDHALVKGVPRPAARRGPRETGPRRGAECGCDRLAVRQGGRRRRVGRPRFRRRQWSTGASGTSWSTRSACSSG
ncbi:transposase [Streptomyces sp. NPDC032161]|uniref:transposase n=1 Tax=unclassified Streptomyces TaxID=2593676 RepID=UPI0033D27979